MDERSRLTIIGKDIHRPGYVICQCECGRVKSIRKSNITKKLKPTLSCGCLQKEVMRVRGREVIGENSKRQIAQNIKYHTNLPVIREEKPPKHNTSGVKGVTWDKETRKWYAYISLHRKRISLGRFKDFEDAVKARKAAEDEYFLPILEEVARDNGK